MDMDILTPVEKLDRLQVDIFLHHYFFLSFSLTYCYGIRNTVTYPPELT